MAKKTYFGSFVDSFWVNRLLVLLFLLGISLRFIFFNSQVWLGSDITRDISISLEALERREIPLTGSFSSAGPFVFGPTLYWLYMFSFLLFPFSLLTPWYGAFIVGAIVIGCFYYLASKFESKILLGLTALITAFSPQMVLGSSSPTQHTYVLVFTLLSIISLYRFYESKKLYWTFICGISIGLAINMHYQAVNLLLLPFVVLFFPSLGFYKKLGSFLLIGLGITLALMPLALWDRGQSFANFRNLFDYLLIGQGRIYVPNSWKIYLFDYLPSYWAYVTGFPSFLSLIVLIGGGCIFVFDFVRTKKITFIFIMDAVFLFMLLLGRYYRGERFPGYTMYLIPFIVIFSAWTVNRVVNLIPDFKFKNGLVYSLIVLLVISVIFSSFTQLRGKLRANPSYGEVKGVVTTLIREYPGRKFRVLNLAGTNPDASYAVAVYLERNKLYSVENSVDVGFCGGCFENENKLGDLFGTSYSTTIENNLDGSWQGVSQAGIYDSTIGWLNKHQLKSTFYLDKYLKEKLQM